MYKQRLANLIMLGVFVFVLSPHGAANAKGFDTGPPAGIVPTSAKLADVLAAHQKAVGKPLESNATLIEDGAISENGLTGTYHEVVAGDSYIDTTTLGPFVSSSGSSGGKDWSEDENGQIVHQSGIHERGSLDAIALDSALTGPSPGVKLLGEVPGPPAAYVVEVNPPNGEREWVFFDKATYFIDRTETIAPSARIISTYSDFKQRNGTWEPWSGFWTDGDATNDEHWHVTSQQTNVAVDPASLDIPAGRTLVEFPTGVRVVTLPIKVIDGDIVVQVMVGGRGYDFQLDSGSGGINVDQAAAKEMGLKEYGKSVETAAGTYTSSESVIPEVDVGPLKMHNVAVTVLPFSVQESSTTEVVGLIGYDFILGSTLRIDYEDQTLQAFGPGQYLPPPDAYALPISLDDQVPVCSARIGSTTGDHFIIDTGATDGFLFPGFAAAHARDITDQGAGTAINIYSSFLYGVGVGGDIQLRPTQVKDFQIGGVVFKNRVVYVLVGDSAQEDQDYDGLIGYDFLQYFNVVFNYRQSYIFLEPNRLFNHDATK